MSRPAGRPPVEAVLVVVPARDEAELLPTCLGSLDAARAVAAVPVVVVVVLDRCLDDTAAVLVGRDVHAVPSLAGRVGAARAIGVRHGLGLLDDVAPERVWVVSTDADSQVPVGWLVHHLELADAGADLVLGTVRLAADGLRPPVLTAWTSAYVHADEHPNVHGANLGVRASAYLRAGGFAALAVHEDVLLAQTVAADPAYTVLRTCGAPVTTSGRLAARAPEGFAGHLRDLDERVG